MKRCLVVAILLVGSTLSFGQSPGGVSTNLLWWLKANAGVYVDNGVTPAANGQTVQFWRDQGPSAKHATTAVVGNRPTYVTNVINGNPALRFTLNHFLDAGSPSGIGGTQSFYIFLVFNPSAYSPGMPSDNTGTFIIDRPSDTNNLTSFKVVNTNKYCYQRRDDSRLNVGGSVTATPITTGAFVIADYFRNYVSAASSTEGIYLNGRLDISQAGPTTSMTGPPIRIGRHALGANLGLNGYFSEIAIYNANLTPAQRQRIESYLALKYGITLDQTTLTDYLRSDGTVIYAASTTRIGFTSDIAGVGRDNAATGSGLYQTTSQSQNANSILSISILNPVLTLANNEFLVWGSNNASLNSTNSSDVDGFLVKQRLSRVWRASESGGDVGMNTVSFDLSTFTGPLNGSDLRVLVDSDGIFAASALAYPGTLNGSTFTASVNLTNGDFFTLATANAITTPLPVTLENFTVAYENPAVVAAWKTATELNNSHFTLERSGTDLSFDEVARVAGAGTSNIPHTYSALDSNPFEGRSYYRLKQTDFDGKVAYLGMQTVFIEPSEKKLSVFPNPADGKPWKLKYSNDIFQLDRVEIMDEQGRLLEVIIPENKKAKEFAIQPRRPLTPGFYVLNVHYNNKQEFVKLVVN